VAREVIVDIDDRARRLVYSAKSERLQHHNASFTVSPNGNGTRVVWVADLLPDAMAQPIGAMMEQGVAAMRKTLDGHSAAA
jgi:carbon monoxide dehydrogenase subunit G